MRNHSKNRIFSTQKVFPFIVRIWQPDIYHANQPQTLRIPTVSRAFTSTAASAEARAIQQSPKMETNIAKVHQSNLGSFAQNGMEAWVPSFVDERDQQTLESAGKYLREKDIPLAFPTETVYGLGADATRTASVKGIYTAKGRPSDNPLIVHVADMGMLRDLLRNEESTTPDEELIPARCKALMEKFWPGPLTILMPNPKRSKLAPEVTAGLTTFGVRMPSSPLALTLIKTARVPLAAPSANASTKPSPTTAYHVKHDLEGRIEMILDGGPCAVGVESTVVDGLCDPPVVLRPGGLSIDEIRQCPGWENVKKAYTDSAEVGKAAPRAPGMKYKHYSPRAKVVLYEHTYQTGAKGVTTDDHDLTTYTLAEAGAQETNGDKPKIVGLIRTRRWAAGANLHCGPRREPRAGEVEAKTDGDSPYPISVSDMLDDQNKTIGTVLDIDLGQDVRGIAQGLFSALRDLDQRGADIIFVDGIDDNLDIAAAVMNRLRKAATEIRT